MSFDLKQIQAGDERNSSTRRLGIKQAHRRAGRLLGCSVARAKRAKVKVS